MANFKICDPIPHQQTPPLRLAAAATRLWRDKALALARPSGIRTIEVSLVSVAFNFNHSIETRFKHTDTQVFLDSHLSIPPPTSEELKKGSTN